MTPGIEKELDEVEKASREARNRLLLARVGGLPKEDVEKEIRMVMASCIRVGVRHMSLVHALAEESGIAVNEVLESVDKELENNDQKR